MKYLKNLTVTLLLLTTTSTLEAVEYLSKGDNVTIKTCDKFGWCKLSDNSGYIKRFYLLQNQTTNSFKVTENKTYLYKKRPVFKNDKNLFKLYDINNDKEYNNFKKTFIYGYLKERDIVNYKELEKNIKSKKNQPIQNDQNQSVQDLKINTTINNTEQTNQKPIITPLTDTNISSNVEPIKSVETPIDTNNTIQIATKTENNIEVENNATNKIETKQTVEKQTKEIIVPKQPSQNYFIYFGEGVSSFNTTHKNNRDFTYDIGVGYKPNENYFLTLNHQGNFENTSNKMRGVEINNYYLSFNKIFQATLKPYIGGIVGYGSTEVYLNPNNFEVINSKKDSGLFYGFQVGGSYPICNNLNFDTKAQYIKNNLQTPNLTIDNQYSILAGLSFFLK